MFIVIIQPISYVMLIVINDIVINRNSKVKILTLNKSHIKILYINDKILILIFKKH